MPVFTESREPGLRPFVPGREEYLVEGGTVLALDLGAGDRLSVTDIEGGQDCEVAAFTADGRPDAAAIGLAGGTPAHGLMRALARPEEGARTLLGALRARGIDPGAGSVTALFGPEAAPEETITFECERPAACLVVASPGDLGPRGGRPATELRVVVQRARFDPDAAPEPAAPLAEPRLDLLVPAATALAYEVHAGEYVQILDVAGRQCSDFMAFDRARLEAGEECRLDSTVTRSLVGAAYPGPGLFSRYYDEDMSPMLEVVRDTVGRHDTFGLACTARTYEMKGYFGHPNCSDNLSDALEPYGVARRAAWPAINLFFNSRIDANNMLSGAEGWTRPGDYVLMRAQSDLVCSTTSCPDDTSAINAWNPTDIRVRVYPAANLFSKAVAYRKMPQSQARLSRETPFHPRTSALTRHFAPAREYWAPVSYTATGEIDEYWACRERVAVMDLSMLRKFEVSGPDAQALLQHCLTRDVRRLSVGQAAYTAMCYPHGGMVDDGVVFRLGPQGFRWTGNDDRGGEWLREQARVLGAKAWVRTATDALANLAVQGPRSRELIAGLLWTPGTQPTLDELGLFRFTIGRLRDNHGPGLMVSRTGFTGELGFEIWTGPDDAVALWDALMDGGEAHGLAPIGSAALDRLRIEAGLISRGAEFDDQVDPFAAGIGFTVALGSKSDDFIGREALARNAAGQTHRLVGLVLDGHEPAVAGDPVQLARARVGLVTSATTSPLLDCCIALARVNAEYALAGTRLEIGKLDGEQKRIAAEVVALPFHDPGRERLRA